jgi:hypothetical protein
VFAEEELVVGGHFEDAAAAADDLAVDAELFLDFSRQTGGSGEVVSNAAVVDSDVHFCSLSRAQRGIRGAACENGA